MKNMNHVIAAKIRWVLALIVFALFANGAFAQKVYRQYSDSWGKQGFNLTASENNKVEIVYSINEFAISDVELNKEILQNIHLKDFVLPNDAGYPDLPGFSKFIAIPQGAKANVKVIASRIEKFENIDMAPAPEILKEDDPRPIPYVKNQKVYSTNAFYPAEPVKISETMHLRGVDAVVLGITPFQYNPVTKELIVYRDFKVEVSFEGGNGKFCDTRYRHRMWDPILENMLLNYSSLPKMDYTHANTTSKDGDTTNLEYIIIIPNDASWLAWADSIKVWRTMQGIKTGIFTTAQIGGNTTTAIENFINNAYNNWTTPPVAVLLMADYGTSGNTVNSPVYDSYCISDNLYADVTGDHLPDIAFARMTAQNATHLQTMVTKFLRYEENPPTDTGFYQHPICALGWQDDRWFQICSEVVDGFWKSQGRHPVRINALGSPASNYVNGPWSTATNTTTVMNYFGPSGLNYIPTNPGTLGGFTGGNATMVNNAINSGAFMLQHRDHGGETGWGEPDYSNSNINSLTNVGTRLPYVFSCNCLTGKFNYASECFAEKFHRYTYSGQNSGCLGILAATEVSYSFVNDAFTWGMYDYMWPDFMPAMNVDTNSPEPRVNMVYPAFANAAGKHFLYNSSWPYNTSNKEVTYYLFHHHGDAFSTVYTQQPQNLTVVHDAALLSGLSTFTITANAGSLIGLTVDGEIIGVGVGTGAPLDIPIASQLPGTVMTVTVTLQDYYRYTSNVSVIPPTGPYVIKDSVAINDAAANNNGQLDYGESVLLSLRVKNVGSANAENVNVTISTTNPYVTITDSTENYGTVNANGNAIVNDGFAISVFPNIPDQNLILLTVTASSDTSNWVSNIAITANSPVFNSSFNTVDDEDTSFSFVTNPNPDTLEPEMPFNYNIAVSDGNGNGNHRLDAGETLNLKYIINNIGHADAQSVNCELTTTSGFITINNNTQNISTIIAGASEDAQFNISVSDTIPAGTSVEFTLTITMGSYSDTLVKSFKVGLIMEDFESGNLTAYNWITNGDANWSVVNTGAYEGTYCAKSGTITHSQSTVLQLTLNVTAADSIGFYKKVSSENNWDFLKFYINGSQKGTWSGESDWSFVQYPVTTGTNIFKWEYMKDGSASAGSDCAWLDFILLPPFAAKSLEIKSITITSSSLPTWLSLVDNGNGTALLSGTPAINDHGIYPVTLTAAQNSEVITQSFNLIVRNTIEIGELLSNDLLSVYPNPAKDKIVVNADRGIKQVKIVSLDGRTVLETNANSNNTEINVSNIDNGSYLLYIITNEGTALKKITILK